MPHGSDLRPAADARLVLQTLGGVALHAVRPGREPERILMEPKPLAVLTYLALAPSRREFRGRLASFVWADVGPAAALNSLRRALSVIRGRIGADGLSTDTDPVVLHAPIECDRDVLTAAWERREFETVVDLYHG